MFTSPTHRQQAVFLGILTSISFTGCSKPAGREPSTESAASSASTALPDSSAPSPDSAPRPSASASSAGSEPEKQVSDTPAKTPKPSIDPGRKPRKSVTIPRQATTPKTDSSTASATATPVSQGSSLKFDAASNTVTFELMAGPFNFNGFSSGGATLTLPPKVNVVINFVNKDGTAHSAEVISGEGPIPNAAVDPAIPRAYTNKVLEGLPQEASDVMRFPSPDSGTYRIFCGVPGHGLSGMWIWMKIDPATKAPSFGPTKG
jgi:hypothetical protein